METLTKVLLVGNKWDLLRPALTALARQSGMLLIEPADQSVPEISPQIAPSVIMVGPGFDYADISLSKSQTAEQLVFPPVLLCITHEALEEDDLYLDTDDFLVVPCTAAELDKRIRRLAQRGQSSRPSTQLRVGKIILNLDNYQVEVEGRRVNLAWMEFQLLKFLMQNQGRVFTREQLLTNVWGFDSFGGTRTIDGTRTIGGSRTVDVHIRRLRSKLGVHCDGYFRTVQNVGYGMVNYP